MIKWYAVQKDSTDAWDNGSYDYDEAVRMLKERGEGLIAVIDDENKVCIEEITIEEVEAEFEAQQADEELDALMEEYRAACAEIARECEEEGYPSHGENYDLRCAQLWRDSYAEYFEEDEEEDDDEGLE